jgi:hypothetical protein
MIGVKCCPTTAMPNSTLSPIAADMLLQKSARAPGGESAKEPKMPGIHGPEARLSALLQFESPPSHSHAQVTHEQHHGTLCALNLTAVSLNANP